MLFPVAYAVVALLAGAAAYRLAERRGRSPRVWMIASVLFVLPALILPLLPSKEATPA